MNAQSQAGQLEQQLFTSGQQAVSTANQLIASGLQSTQMTSQMQEYLINLDNQLSPEYRSGHHQVCRVARTAGRGAEVHAASE